MHFTESYQSTGLKVFVAGLKTKKQKKLIVKKRIYCGIFSLLRISLNYITKIYGSLRVRNADSFPVLQ